MEDLVISSSKHRQIKQKMNDQNNGSNKSQHRIFDVVKNFI